MGKVRVFDDLYSWFHFFVSLLVTYLSPVAAIAATICFVEYQRWERERRSEKLGDFIEWMVGILIGVLTRVIVCGGVCIC